MDGSSFAQKSNLVSLKTEVDKLDIDKLAPVPVDVISLIDVEKNDVVKKTEYDKLVTKVDNTDTTGFVLKTTYDTDKSDVEKQLLMQIKKISDTTDLAKKMLDLNDKIIEIEVKILSITGLVTNSALPAVENKVSDVINLVKKKQIVIQKLVKLKRKF